MGIPRDEIIYIKKNNLSDYSGEPVLLPVAFPLFEYQPDSVANWFSPMIAPDFLGHILAKETLSPREIDYYKRFEPIGCRDERMLNTLQNHNIKAYLNGCMTATLPLRTQNSKEPQTIFVVDAPKWIIETMPEEVKAKAEFYSHYIECSSNIKNLAIDRYTQYSFNSCCS